MSTCVGRESDKFSLRFPDGMRDRIKSAATQNFRSMNAEIVIALDRAFPAHEPRTETEDSLQAVPSASATKKGAALQGRAHHTNGNRTSADAL